MSTPLGNTLRIIPSGKCTMNEAVCRQPHLIRNNTMPRSLLFIVSSTKKRKHYAAPAEIHTYSLSSVGYDLNMRLTKLLAMLPAKLVDPKAPPAKFDAWLNLSHRENASVLMIVRANAIAKKKKNQCKRLFCPTSRKDKKLTNKRQPQKLQPYNRQNRHQNPPHRLHVQRQPEEAAVRRVDLPRARLQALKHPLRLARLRVDLVPPPQADQPPARNVLEVVEIRGQQQNRNDEDHDPKKLFFSDISRLKQTRTKEVQDCYTHMLLMTHNPKK